MRTGGCHSEIAGHSLRVPLRAHDGECPVVIGLNKGSVLGPGIRHKVPSKILDCLMMEAVHGKDGSKELFIDAPGGNAHIVDGVVGMDISRLGWDVLPKGSAKIHIDHLTAAADPENGLLLLNESVQKCELQSISLFIGTAAAIEWLLTVACGRDIESAGEEETVRLIGKLHGIRSRDIGGKKRQASSD